MLPEELPSAGAKSVAIDTHWAGKNLGRYKVLSVLGQGGMGVVWRGHDDSLRRDVALKILSRKSTSNGGCINTQLFMQEARAVAKLQHPAVVSIFEVGEDAGQVFLSLELMEGGTLKEHIDTKGVIPAAELWAMLVGPAKALALAHRRGIIHRDIKPGNLMFDDHGHLKLMDFGLADVADELASQRIRGKAVGSLGWIAPETARGKGTTPSSDLFSFGLVILYALTGKPFIHADTRSKLLALHQNPPTLDLNGIKGLTASGTELLKKCLAIEPEERFASASELAEALEHCAEEDPAAVKKQRRSKASIAVIGSIFGAMIGVAAVLYYFIHLDDRINEYSQPVIRQTKAPAAEETKGGALAAPKSPTSPDVLTPPSTVVTVAPTPKPADATGSPESGTTPRFASLEEARVPWPQVPYLLDIPNIKFVGSKASEVFHTATKDCGRSIFASNLIVFTSIDEALKAGRKACPRCRPGVNPVALNRDEP
jgi:serine/threonine protein kinase